MVARVPMFSDQFGHIREARWRAYFFVGVDAAEHKAEVIDLSQDQLILCTHNQLQTGMRLTIVIHVPSEVSGSPFCEIEVAGNIVRESKSAGAMFGYQVQLAPKGNTITP